MPRLTEQSKSANPQRLLGVAAAAFARENANINEISLAAGFAKGTVYNHRKGRFEIARIHFARA